MELRFGLCALVAALAASGCGEDLEAPEDRSQVASFVRDFFDGARDGNAEAICSVLTPDGRAWAAGRSFSIPNGTSLADGSPRRAASYARSP